jgi:hypothetical protein
VQVRHVNEYMPLMSCGLGECMVVVCGLVSCVVAFEGNFDICVSE